MKRPHKTDRETTLSDEAEWMNNIALRDLLGIESPGGNGPSRADPARLCGQAVDNDRERPGMMEHDQLAARALGIVDRWRKRELSEAERDDQLLGLLTPDALRSVVDALPDDVRHPFILFLRESVEGVLEPSDVRMAWGVTGRPEAVRAALLAAERHLAGLVPAIWDAVDNPRGGEVKPLTPQEQMVARHQWVEWTTMGLVFGWDTHGHRGREHVIAALTVGERAGALESAGNRSWRLCRGYTIESARGLIELVGG